MSMLAEPKRKQKWSLNPRGKIWSQDTNKFGHKMLEKMGWSQGKGLGANEDGMVEHIKVSHKNNSTGIGYKESDDQWTEHESNFTALLKALSGGEEKLHEIKLNSLEEKSQKSRARVHYKKFTRGKDLSKYSEKDLANIFGKKSLKEFKKVKKEQGELENEHDVKEENDTKEMEKSNLFSKGGLISDYFKKKLPSFGNVNGFVVGNNGVLQKAEDSESESELRPSFGFGFKQKESIEEEGNQIFAYTNDVEKGLKKKSKKKRNLEEDSGTFVDTPTKKKKLEPCDVHMDTPIKVKKEKLKKKLEVEPQSGLSNLAFDPLYTPFKVEKHILESIEESPSELSNVTLNDTVGQVAKSFEVTVQINNEGTPVRMKKEEGGEVDNVKRKKKNKKDKIVDMDISYQSEESLDPTVNHTKLKKNKMLKKVDEPNEISSSSLNIEEISQSEQTCNDTLQKKNKKRKKSKTNSIESLDTALNDNEQSVISKKKKSETTVSTEGLDNPLFNMSIENEESTVSQTENPFELKIKEKKKRKKNKDKKENYAVENPMFNGEDSVNSEDVTNEAFEIKRKDKSKKVKKDKEDSRGLDNPALNLNDSIDESCDLMLNVVTTPIIIQDQTSTLDKTFSIQKVTGVKRRKSVRFSDVTRERIIPNKDAMEQEILEDSRDIVELNGKLNDSAELSYIDKFIQKKQAKKRKRGLDNSAFDKQAANMEENITSISNTLDTYQAEIENDMNEAKLKTVEVEDIMVGEVGNPNGTNEILPDGSVKLKFKNAKFNKSARFIDGLTGAKKSYKHLIKGDIVMKFKKTNLHEVEGYAIKAS